MLQRNLPFLVFPIIFFLTKNPAIRKYIVKLSLIISAFVASIYCEIFNYGQWKWFNSFNQYDFTIYEYFTHHWFTYGVLTQWIDLQPSFFALYIIIAIIFILQYLTEFNSKKATNIILGIFFLIYFVLFMFHLSSRIGLVIMIGVLVYYLFRLRIPSLYKVSIFALSVVAFGTILLNSRFIERFKELSITFKEEAVDKGDNIVNAKRIRVYALQAFLNQEPLKFITGRGTGDSQEYLDSFFEQKIVNNPKAIKNKQKWKLKGTHYHNQFIQTNVETGILGLMALLAIFFLSLKESIKKKCKEHMLFVVICFLFFMFDSVLMRQKGIVFFTLFNIMFIANYYKNESIVQNN